MFIPPLICNYYVTLRCNDTCEFCGIWQKQEFEQIEESPLENIVKNLEALKMIGVKRIDFTGGEPLLRADIPQILRASKRLGFKNILTTNGILFKDRAFEISPFIDTILFSLDSPFADEHDRIRGLSCYDNVIEGIKHAKKNIGNIMINFTLTRESILYLPEMVDLAERLGVLLWVNPVFNYGGMEGFEKRSIEYIKRYKSRKNVGFNLASLDLIKKGGNKINRAICRAVDSVVTILPDDRLVFPCFYKQEFSAKIDGKLKGLYNKARLDKYRSKQGRYEECRNCLAWPYMNPSFLYKLDRRFFLAIYSLGSLFLKQRILRRGR